MDDYLERITAMKRCPTMTPDYPNFPNVHEVMSHNTPCREKPVYHVNHHKHHVPQEHKKVHFFKHIEVTEIDDCGKPHKGHEYKSIDSEADGFIQQKHRNFELCKWDTFKVKQ